MKRAFAMISLIIMLGLSTLAQEKPNVRLVANRPNNPLDQQLVAILTERLSGHFSLIQEKNEALFKLFVQAHPAKDEGKITAELYVMVMIDAGKPGRAFPVTWLYTREADSVEHAARRLSQAFAHDAQRLIPFLLTRKASDQPLAEALGAPPR